MALKIGIVGLPNVGKSTLFNALTRSRGAVAANYPFCTIDPNVGVVEVPDPRLQKLVELVKPKKVIPATVEFVDIAGLVRGASKGEGLGNQFLHHIREVDAICHVVRGFPGGDVIHVEGDIAPERDRGIVELELALADLETVRKRMDKVQGAARTGDKAKIIELSTLKKFEAALEQGKQARDVSVDTDEKESVLGIQLLTGKPVLYALNVNETQLKTVTPADAATLLKLSAAATVVVLCAKVEEDLLDLPPADAQGLLQELGVTTSGLDQLAKAAYSALGYITFFTAGPEEVRAWTVHRGATAPQAAGVIHTDFEKGFICAETIAYDDFIGLGGELKAKEAGKMRQEGKAYIVQDGDVFHFRFNV